MWEKKDHDARLLWDNSTEQLTNTKEALIWSEVHDSPQAPCIILTTAHHTSILSIRWQISGRTASQRNTTWQSRERCHQNLLLLIPSLVMTQGSMIHAED